jgi:hypothetical protein
MIEDNFKNHIGYYAASVGVMILGLLLIVLAGGNRQTQMFSLLAITLFYVVFALLHHIHDHDLTPKIVIEYSLFGSLGLAIAMFALYFN